MYLSKLEPEIRDCEMWYAGVAGRSMLLVLGRAILSAYII
jgi:hypothetical protein